MGNSTKKQFIYSRILIALVVLLLVGAFAAKELGSPVIYVLMTTVIVFSVSEGSRNRRLTFGILLIGVLNVSASLWIAFWPHPEVLAIVVARSLGAFFVAVVGGFMLRKMWQLRHVTLDSIGGGLAVYLLLGVGWTHLYALVETFDPGSFITRTLDGSAHGLTEYRSGTYPQLFFFSFVTLTTLGYGDILPVSSAAKGLAIAEAIVGPVFLAILMARLVGLYVAQETREAEKPGSDGRA